MFDLRSEWTMGLFCCGEGFSILVSVRCHFEVEVYPVTEYIHFEEESELFVIRDDFLGTGTAISGPLRFRLAICC